MIGKKKNFWAKLIFYYCSLLQFLSFLCITWKENFFFLAKTREIEYKINDDRWMFLEVSKKKQNWLNRENWKNNNWKNRTVKENRLNRLKFWKNRPVRFRFYKPETEKTEPNWTQTEKMKKTRAKPSQNRKNRAKLVFVQKNRTELKPVCLN